MVLAPPTVTVNLSGLKKFGQTVDGNLRRMENGPIRDALKQWAARYRGFIQARYVRMSKGGWQKLKRKRKRGAKSAALILRNDGILMAVFEPVWSDKPGALQKDIPFGVRAGYGGPARHPKGRATVADIAKFHQIGAGPLPVREIIVAPDSSLVARMVSDMDRALTKLGRRDSG